MHVSKKKIFKSNINLSFLPTRVRYKNSMFLGSRFRVEDSGVGEGLEFVDMKTVYMQIL